MISVYVIEDSKPVRMRITESVEAIAGYEVVGVADSEEQAVPAIARLRPDVIVADIQLKQGSGMAILQRVREASTQADAPRPLILILSNYAASDYKEHALAGGADAVFDKVSEFGEFLELLEQRSKASA